MLISPIILASLVILIFFFPNVLDEYMIQPAFTAVLPVYAGSGGIDLKISAWHGWTPELFMTIGVIVIGALMYRSIRKWVVIYRYYPKVLTLNNLYTEVINKMELFSFELTNRYMTGSIRSYSYIYLPSLFWYLVVQVGCLMESPLIPHKMQQLVSMKVV